MRTRSLAVCLVLGALIGRHAKGQRAGVPLVQDLYDAHWTTGELSIEEHYPHKGEGPRLFLVFKTDNPYPCAGGFPIPAKVSIAGDRMKLELGDVRYVAKRLHVLCPGAIGYATFETELKGLPANFRVELAHGEQMDTWAVSVTPEHVRVNPVQTSFSTWRGMDIERMPADGLWTECIPLDHNDPGVCATFFDEVARLAARRNPPKAGGVPIHLGWHYTGSPEAIFKILRRARRPGYFLRAGTPTSWTLTCAGRGRCSLAMTNRPSLADSF